MVLRTLYEWPPTRSHRAKWALEELGVAFSSVMVDLGKGMQNSDDYRSLHPLGCVPAFETDDYQIFESIAIVLQLIDEHPEQNLAPPLGGSERAYYYQWCVFAASELDPALMLYFDNSMRPLEAMRPAGTLHDPKLAKRGRGDFFERARCLVDVLETRDFLLGAEFSGADIVVGHSCFMAQHMGLLDQFPVLQSYFSRLSQREAHKKVYDMLGN